MAVSIKPITLTQRNEIHPWFITAEHLEENHWESTSHSLTHSSYYVSTGRRRTRHNLHLSGVVVQGAKLEYCSPSEITTGSIAIELSETLLATCSLCFWLHSERKWPPDLRPTSTVLCAVISLKIQFFFPVATASVKSASGDGGEGKKHSSVLFVSAYLGRKTHLATWHWRICVRPFYWRVISSRGFTSF